MDGSDGIVGTKVEHLQLDHIHNALGNKKSFHPLPQQGVLRPLPLRVLEVEVVLVGVVGAAHHISYHISHHKLPPDHQFLPLDILHYRLLLILPISKERPRVTQPRCLLGDH